MGIKKSPKVRAFILYHIHFAANKLNLVYQYSSRQCVLLQAASNIAKQILPAHKLFDFGNIEQSVGNKVLWLAVSYQYVILKADTYSLLRNIQAGFACDYHARFVDRAVTGVVGVQSQGMENPVIVIL